MEHNPTGLKIHPHVGKLLEIKLEEDDATALAGYNCCAGPVVPECGWSGLHHTDIPTARKPGGAGCRPSL